MQAPAVYECWIELLEASGVSAQWWLVILEGLEGITYGSALAAASTARAGMRTDEFDPAAFPALSRVFRAERRTSEQLFVAAVRAFLVGVAAD